MTISAASGVARAARGRLPRTLLRGLGVKMGTGVGEREGSFSFEALLESTSPSDSSSSICVLCCTLALFSLMSKLELESGRCDAPLRIITVEEDVFGAPFE